MEANMAGKRTKQSSSEAHTADEETLWKIEKCHKEVKIARLHTRSLEMQMAPPAATHEL